MWISTKAQYGLRVLVECYHLRLAAFECSLEC
jgi:hypothetical protein